MKVDTNQGLEDKPVSVHTPMMKSACLIIGAGGHGRSVRRGRIAAAGLCIDSIPGRCGHRSSVCVTARSGAQRDAGRVHDPNDVVIVSDRNKYCVRPCTSECRRRIGAGDGGPSGSNGVTHAALGRGTESWPAMSWEPGSGLARE